MPVVLAIGMRISLRVFFLISRGMVGREERCVCVRETEREREREICDMVVFFGRLPPQYLSIIKI